MENTQEQSPLQKLHALIDDVSVNEVIHEIRSIVGFGVSIRKLIEEYEQPVHILAKLRQYIPLELVLKLNPTKLYYEAGRELDRGDAETVVDDIGAFVSNVIDLVVADRVATSADDYDLDEEEIVFSQGFTQVEGVSRLEDNVYIVKTNVGSMVVFVNEGGKIDHMTNEIGEEGRNLIINFMKENNIHDPRMVKAEITVEPDSVVVATCSDESVGCLRIALDYVPSDYTHTKKIRLPNRYKGDEKFCYVFSNSEKEMLAVSNIISLIEDSNVADCFEEQIHSHIEKDGVNVYQM